MRTLNSPLLASTAAGARMTVPAAGKASYSNRSTAKALWKNAVISMIAALNWRVRNHFAS